MAGKKLLSEIAFWIHLPVVIIWFGLFFIPASVWENQITFHFWYVSTIILVQLLWGIVLYPQTKRLNLLCPLTTLMQSLRGYRIENPRNNGHSFVSELFERLNVKISSNAVTGLILISFAVVLIQYILSR